MYSEDLVTVIKMMIQVDPKKRLSCTQMLSTKIIKNYECFVPELFGKPKEKANSKLLNTIKVPFNLKAISNQLPKPKYDTYNYFSVNPVEEHPLLEINIIDSLNSNRVSKKNLIEYDKLIIDNRALKNKINYNYQKIAKENGESIIFIDDDSNDKIDVNKKNNILPPIISRKKMLLNKNLNSQMAALLQNEIKIRRSKNVYENSPYKPTNRQYINNSLKNLEQIILEKRNEDKQIFNIQSPKYFSPVIQKAKINHKVKQVKIQPEWWG